MFVCYSAAFCQLCFYNKDWIGLETKNVHVVPSWIGAEAREDTKYGGSQDWLSVGFGIIPMGGINAKSTCLISSLSCTFCH